MTDEPRTITFTLTEDSGYWIVRSGELPPFITDGSSIPHALIHAAILLLEFPEEWGDCTAADLTTNPHDMHASLRILASLCGAPLDNQPMWSWFVKKVRDERERIRARFKR